VLGRLSAELQTRGVLQREKGGHKKNLKVLSCGNSDEEEDEEEDLPP